MVERCAHCGQRLPPKGLPEGVKFSIVRQRIWNGINSFPGMSIQELMDWVYGNVRDAPLSSNIMSVQIAFMNKQLKPHGLKIRGHISLGYRVTKLEVEKDAVATNT